ncbi:DUF6473 family protein [Ascidiaceihabitans sp.]|nr:DUF6473 family protein [Ascidiaceihabitans sp.]
MTHDALGAGGLDYLPCRYGTSKLLFRGPRRPLKDPYLAFMGGRNVQKVHCQPISKLIEQRICKTCINLGCMSAGVDVFATDLQVARMALGADVTVLQLIVGTQHVQPVLHGPPEAQ